jgi:hypothetical protein
VPRGEKPPVAGGKLGLPDTVAQGISKRSFLGALKNKIKITMFVCFFVFSCLGLLKVVFWCAEIKKNNEGASRREKNRI